MRVLEILLLISPALLVLGWRFGLLRARLSVFLGLACVLAGLGATLIWLGESRHVSGDYRPARLHDGRISGPG